ncbi:MAG: MBL fold metallo-hydrolase [Clostridia bacterium]|nr:MBL fold metallo-hydrolase [Clostridia bacterium]
MAGIRKRGRLLAGLFALLWLVSAEAGAAAGSKDREPLAAAYPSALFLNVGKADCAAVFLGGNTFLVDTGSKASAGLMLDGLAACGVTRLAGVFVTHTDRDHTGGLKRLLESKIQVERLYAPGIHTEESDEGHPVYGASQKYAVPMTWLSSGDRVDGGGGSSFQVLGPLSRDPEENNNNSLVMLLDTPQGTMLFTGDMETQEETELMRAGMIPGADVLKVGYHGKNSASSVSFLATVRPQWAVISTSSAEDKDSPAPKVMERLWRVKANVAVTQDAGLGILVTLREGVADGLAVDWPRQE